MWKQLNTLGIENVSWHSVHRMFGFPADSISESEVEAVVTVSLCDGVGEAISLSGVSLSVQSESTQRIETVNNSLIF